MAKRSNKSVRAKSPRGAASVGGGVGGSRSGRRLQGGQPKNAGSRGSSIQGERQAAKGGPAGASQGGAPRGAACLEPSTLKKGTGRVAGKRHQNRGRERPSERH